WRAMVPGDGAEMRPLCETCESKVTYAVSASLSDYLPGRRKMDAQKGVSIFTLERGSAIEHVHQCVIAPDIAAARRRLRGNLGVYSRTSRTVRFCARGANS